MIKRYLFIVNEHSKKGKKAVQIIQHEMNKTPHAYTIIKTSSANQGTYLFEKFAYEEPLSTLLVAVGGDGMMNQAVTGLQNGGHHRPLACIPTGTGNDFARAVGLTTDIEEAVSHLLSVESPQSRDVLAFSDGEKTAYAVNSVGFGIDGLANHYGQQTRTSRSVLKRWVPSQMYYLSSGIRAFMDQEPYSLFLNVEGEFFHFDQVQLFGAYNHPYFGGGIPISPNSDSQDGRFEILVAHDFSGPDFMKILPGVFQDGQHLESEKIATFQSSQFEFYMHHSDVYGQKDGEVFQSQTDFYKLWLASQEFWI